MKVSEWIRAYAKYFYTNYVNPVCTKTLSLGALSYFNLNGYELCWPFLGGGVLRIFRLPFFIVLGLKWTILKSECSGPNFGETERSCNPWSTILVEIDRCQIPKWTDVSKWKARMFKLRQFKNTEMSFHQSQVHRPLQSWPSEINIWRSQSSSDQRSGNNPGQNRTWGQSLLEVEIISFWHEMEAVNNFLF